MVGRPWCRAERRSPHRGKPRPCPSDVVGALVVVGIIILGRAHHRVGGRRPRRVPAGLRLRCSAASWRSGGAGPSPSRRSPPSPAGCISARGYPGGPALLPGPLALLAARLPGTAAGRAGSAPPPTSPSRHRRAPGRGRDRASASSAVSSGWASAAVLRRAGDRRPGASGPRPNASARAHAAGAGDSPTSGCVSPRTFTTRVAHAMATINVQSGVAAHLLDRDPVAGQGCAGGDPGGEQRRPRRARA